MLTGTRACSDAEMSSVHPGPELLPWCTVGASATSSSPAGPKSGSSSVSGGWPSLSVQQEHVSHGSLQPACVNHQQPLHFKSMFQMWPQ